MGALSEFVQFKNGKKRPNDSGTIPVYGGNGIMGYTQVSNYSNCVIIGRVGAYCGNVYYEPNRCWVSDNAIVAISKNNSDIRYTYYLLKELRLNERHIGTSQPLLTQEILNKIECRIAPICDQRKIAYCLGLIDDKIRINNDINDNLAA